MRSNDVVYFISTRNEATGSCFSIKGLKSLVKKFNISSSIVTSDGSFFGDVKTLVHTNFNMIDICKNVFNLYKIDATKNDTIIFNTILALPYYLFYFKSNKKFLYVHEQNLKPSILYTVINILINLFNVKVMCVNPSMLKRYRKAFLVPNYLPLEHKSKSIKKVKNQILMISNCYLEKGVPDFIKLAGKYSEFSFILLTNKELMKDDCKEALRNIPKNLHIEYGQMKKEELLESSEYLVSLSYANETFGLVLLEAILSGTLPISVVNDGSKYCLDNNTSLIKDRDTLYNSFASIVEENRKNYESLLAEVYSYTASEFSEENVFSRFKEAMT